jgi:hypothetical protein
MAITAEQEQKLRALLKQYLNPPEDYGEEEEEEDDGRGDMPWGEDGAMYAYERGMTHGREDGRIEGMRDGEQYIADQILEIIGKD